MMFSLAKSEKIFLSFALVYTLHDKIKCEELTVVEKVPVL